MRTLVLVLVAACAAEDGDDTIDLGSIADGRSDAPELRDLEVSIPESSSGKPGAREFRVTSTVDFDVSLAYTLPTEAKLVVSNVDIGVKFEGERGVQPTVGVIAAAGPGQSFNIRIENYGTATLDAKLSAIGKLGVSRDVIVAARANLDRIAKEIDSTHLQAYGLKGSTTDQFMSALSDEYQRQHPDQYAARVTALASMSFFALPDVTPPVGGKLTPFHGLDMTQFDQLASIEDQIFDHLTQLNNNNPNGVRPFSVCETTYIIETYVRPRATFPGFDAHKLAYATYAASCPQKDRDEWYSFRGLGGLRPSWVESNLADQFTQRMATNCRTSAASWQSECAVWGADRFGYRQLRNRQLAARTFYYAPEDEQYLSDPNNSLVLLEDRNGDGIGEYVRPGPITLCTGERGTLRVNSTGPLTGNLEFIDQMATIRAITPAVLIANETADPMWNAERLGDKDMGLMAVFASSTGCTGPSIDRAQCPLMQRFSSMIDRHESFDRTYSALAPDYNDISSQPSPLVASSITLPPPGDSAGFIFLMRIPFTDIVTGNDNSVATLMPGPKTTSIQSLYAGTGKLDVASMWLDIASLSNNKYATGREIAAFGAVPANEIEGILVVRKPAAAP